MNKKSCVILLLGMAIGLVAYGRQVMGEDWPQWRGPTRDGVWKETGIVEKFSAPQIPVRWRAAISSGYSGPTVAEGRVYVSDLQTDPSPAERVHCFDWKTGHSLWSFSYDCAYKNVGYMAGPRASVSIDDGRAYALGTTGHLHCLDAATGKLLWKKHPESSMSLFAMIGNWSVPAWLQMLTLNVGSFTMPCSASYPSLSMSYARFTPQ